jgi:hypothetical protein
MEIAKKEGSCWAEVRTTPGCYSNWVLTMHREMQLFLLGYIVISICEIFTIGGFPLNDSVRIVCFLPTLLYSSL